MAESPQISKGLVQPHDRGIVKSAYEAAVDPATPADIAVGQIERVKHVFEVNNVPLNASTIQDTFNVEGSVFDRVVRDRALEAATASFADAQLLDSEGESAIASLKHTQDYLDLAASVDGFSLDDAYDVLGITEEDFRALTEKHAGTFQTKRVEMAIDGMNVTPVLKPR